MKRLFLTVFTIPLLLVWTLFMLPIFIVLCAYNQSRAFQWMAPIWGKLFCWLALVKLNCQGLDNIDRSQSYVVIANHASQFDIPIVAGWLSMDLKWVVKSEYRKHPVLGPICVVMGNAFVDRGNTEKAIASLENVKKRLCGGTSLLFFPEGTRSKTGRMQPFKKGAFIMAKDLGFRILPVSIRGADQLLPAGKIFPRGGTADLVVHSAIPAADVAELALDVLMQKAHDMIQTRVEPHSS